MGLDYKEPNPKKTFFSSINKKLTLLFVIFALIAPALVIYYFYIIATSVIPEPLLSEQITLLETTAAVIIVLIAINAGVIGLLISRSISKPIKELYNAAQEVEKGNFDVSLIKEVKEIHKDIIPRPLQSNLSTDKFRDVCTTHLHNVDEGISTFIEKMKISEALDDSKHHGFNLQ